MIFLYKLAKSSLGQMFDRKQISEHTWASLFFKCTWKNAVNNFSPQGLKQKKVQTQN